MTKFKWQVPDVSVDDIISGAAKAIWDQIDQKIIAELLFVLPSVPGDIVVSSQNDAVVIAVTSPMASTNESYVLRKNDASWQRLYSDCSVL